LKNEQKDVANRIYRIMTRKMLPMSEFIEKMTRKMLPMSQFIEK
jgi:hypothetical protein